MTNDFRPVRLLPVDRRTFVPRRWDRSPTRVPSTRPCLQWGVHLRRGVVDSVRQSRTHDCVRQTPRVAACCDRGIDGRYAGKAAGNATGAIWGRPGACCGQRCGKERSTGTRGRRARRYSATDSNSTASRCCVKRRWGDDTTSNGNGSGRFGKEDGLSIFAMTQRVFVAGVAPRVLPEVNTP